MVLARPDPFPAAQPSTTTDGTEMTVIAAGSQADAGAIFGGNATALPDEAAICAITLAELTAVPHLASTGDERARRQARLQQVEATFDPLASIPPRPAATVRSSPRSWR